MVKAIKFNLIIDNQPIRNLEDLTANFNIHDIMEAYQSGILERWLVVRGYTELAEKVASLRNTNSLDVVNKICEIFIVDIDEERIIEAANTFDYQNELKKKLIKYRKNLFRRNEVIDEYHAGYGDLCRGITKNMLSYGFLKSAFEILWCNFSRLFVLDFDRFYNYHLSESPHVLVSMLANYGIISSKICSDSRKEELFKKLMSQIEYNSEIYNFEMSKAFLSAFSKQNLDIDKKLVVFRADTNGQFVKVTNNLVNVVSVLNSSGRVRLRSDDNLRIPTKKFLQDEIYRGLQISTMSDNDGVAYINSFQGSEDDQATGSILETTTCDANNASVGFPYKFFSGATDSYWKDIVPKGTPCMILMINDGDFVRNAGASGEELGTDQINGKFLILDGIDYKSNDSNRTLIYLEV